jgi:hypothetical protein
MDAGLVASSPSQGCNILTLNTRKDERIFASMEQYPVSGQRSVAVLVKSFMKYCCLA